MKSRAGRCPSHRGKSGRTILFVSLSIFTAAASAGIFLVINHFGAIADGAVSRTADLNSDSVVVRRTSRLPFPKPYEIVYRGRTADTRAIVRFREKLYSATAAGLLEFTSDGEMIRHFSVVDGLPEADLTSLAVFRDELFIGTRGSGLISFDGARFYEYDTGEATGISISTLAVGDDRLLVGTTTAGLFEFDGRNLLPVRFEGKHIPFPTAMLIAADITAVGTFDSGLCISNRGEWRRFDVSSGLGSNRVTGLLTDGAWIFAATDLGVSRIEIRTLGEGTARFERVSPITGVSGLAVFGEQFVVGTEDGRLAVIDRNGREFHSPASPVGRRVRLVQDDGTIMLIGAAGIARAEIANQELSITRIYTPPTEETGFSEVSALVAGIDGRVFAGGFRGGIEELTADLRRVSELGGNDTREINSISYENGRLRVGSMNGAFEISPTAPTVVMPIAKERNTKQTNSTARFSVDGSMTTAISTNEGLTLISDGSTRHFSTVNGLPSNSVFGCARLGDSIYAATMSGLAEIKDGRVRSVKTSANSRLPHNWITALAVQNGRIVGGTYGGGLFAIDANGEISVIETPTGGKFVNPNAIFADERNVFAGTTAGFLVLAEASTSAVIYDETLPSKMVLSIAATREYAYAGTNSGIVRIERRALPE